jgi:hypothetical protein
MKSSWIRYFGLFPLNVSGGHAEIVLTSRGMSGLIAHQDDEESRSKWKEATF